MFEVRVGLIGKECFIKNIVYKLDVRTMVL